MKEMEDTIKDLVETKQTGSIKHLCSKDNF